MHTNVAHARWAGLLVVSAALAWVVLSPVRHTASAGPTAPLDVTGQDCTLCHGTFAQDYTHAHAPAAENDCTACHLTEGSTGHGGLVEDGRRLCLPCHGLQQEHYPLASCDSSGCHADVHGSNANQLLLPEREEEYPGFDAATAGERYLGSDTCLGCHGGKCHWWAESTHSLNDLDEKTPPEKRGCESCHGPGGGHWGRWAGIGDFALASAEETAALCLKCHAGTTYAPDYLRGVHLKNGVTCTSCHNPHDTAREHALVADQTALCLECHSGVRSDFIKFSHHPVDLPDNRSGMQCSACHDAHGGTAPGMLKAGAEELCLTCHTDKAGPFAYPHAGYEPGLGEGCFTCHEPHGSTAPSLLCISDRGVCLQCHTEMGLHMSGQTCWTTGCHTAHHGSNSSFRFFE